VTALRLLAGASILLVVIAVVTGNAAVQMAAR